jgi:hypothetical protein
MLAKKAEKKAVFFFSATTGRYLKEQTRSILSPFSGSISSSTFFSMSLNDLGITPVRMPP